MSEEKKVWRDGQGNIRCPGNACPRECDETCPVWLNARGAEKLTRSQPEQAIPDFRRAADLEPDFPDAFRGLGAACGMCGRHKEALEAFDRALELKKDDPGAMIGKIVAEKNLGMCVDVLTPRDIDKMLAKKSAEPGGNAAMKARSREEAPRDRWTALALRLLEDGKKTADARSEGFPRRG